MPWISGANRRKWPCRVFVCDDNIDAAETLTALIRVMGHECEYTTKPLLVLEEVRRYQPTVVILDLGMPELDGYTLGNQLRQAFGFEAFYLVALSGWAAAGDRELTRKTGFDAHLAKPGEADMLKAMFQEVRGVAHRPR